MTGDVISRLIIGAAFCVLMAFGVFVSLVAFAVATVGVLG